MADRDGVDLCLLLDRAVFRCARLVVFVTDPVDEHALFERVLNLGGKGLEGHHGEPLWGLKALTLFGDGKGTDKDFLGWWGRATPRIGAKAPGKRHPRLGVLPGFRQRSLI